jgi:hypothetical protein
MEKTFRLCACGCGENIPNRDKKGRGVSTKIIIMRELYSERDAPIGEVEDTSRLQVML